MITLHHCPQTRSMRSLWLLHELDVPFDVEVYPFDKSLRAPTFLEKSPAGRVPALDIDGLRLFETGAIAQYLCERFSPDQLGRTWASPERAEWLVWMHFAETISQHVAALTQQHIALRDDHMRSPVLMNLEAARLGKCYGAIERQLARSGDYLLPGGFSAADIAVGQAIYMGQHFTRIQGFSHLEGWIGRLVERPAFQAALPKPGEALLYEKEFYPPWPMP
jgi:glutathione S-transferase